MFRKEAVEQKAISFYGDVVIKEFAFIRYVNFALIALLILSLLLSFAIQYQEKHSVSGWVEPDSGFHRVTVQQNGIIQKLFVKESQYVEHNAPLFQLGTGISMLSGETLETTLNNEAATQLTIIDDQILLVRQRYAFTLLEIERKLAAKQAQIKLIQSQLKTMQMRDELLEKRIASVEDLEHLGHMSSLELDSLRDLSLSIQSEMLRIEREQLDNQEQIKGLNTQQQASKNEHAQILHELNKKASSLRQSLARYEADQTRLFVAPTSGRVTNLQIHQGQQVAKNDLVVHLLPDYDHMIGYILVPVKLSGQLKPEQKVTLSYDAFHQHEYGFFSATINSISRSVLIPGEITSIPVTIKTPVVKVALKLDKQEYADIDLLPGMTLSASIIVEEKSLFDWFTSKIVGREELN